MSSSTFRSGRPARYLALTYRFESEHGLAAVRRDPEMQVLASLRQEVVRKALLLRVEEVPLAAYFAPGA